MFAFPDMLKYAAELAGIKTPENCEDFNPEYYPHFEVFCIMQLGQPMPYPGVHFDNAKIIASIPDDKIKLITGQELLDLGFKVGTPIP